SLTPAEERDTCSRLLKYGLQALDIFFITLHGSGAVAQNKNKEEMRETVEAFAGLFMFIKQEAFTEIFSNYLPFLIERMAVNSALLIIVNSYLVAVEVSPVFGPLLAQYLVTKIPELTVSKDRMNLYLQLFKILFISLAHTGPTTTHTKVENIDMILRPYLHQIVRDSMRYALVSREPLCYFLVLRPLFRAIGQGGPEVQTLYSEFLALTPSLLSFLNRMQSEGHNSVQRELCRDLCLSLCNDGCSPLAVVSNVPLRLSSLLPHLPLLMDPLIQALINTSTSAIKQGLRTIEMFIDNLQPEYLHEHISPIRAQLIQALWGFVSKSPDLDSAQQALRILGKFGATNRRMLSEPQPLHSLRVADADPLCVRVAFERPPLLHLPGPEPEWGGAAAAPRTVKMEIASSSMSSLSLQTGVKNGEETSLPPTGPIVGDLCLSEAVKAAVENLRLSSKSDERLQYSSTDHVIPPQHEMRRHAVALCETVLKAAVGEEKEKGSEERIRRKLEAMNPVSLRSASIYRSSNETARRMYVHALTGVAIGKDIDAARLKFFTAIVRHMTMQALLEQLEPPSDPSSCMDGLIVVDVMKIMLTDPGKLEFGHTGMAMLRIVCESCCKAAGDLVTFCALPLMHHMMRQLSELCFSSSSVSKIGGAAALAYLVEEFPRVMLRQHLEGILRALVETMVGLANEVSWGAIDVAAGAIHRLMVARFVGRDWKSETSIRVMLAANDLEDLWFDEAEGIRIRTVLTEILVPLLESTDTNTQKIAVKLMTSFSSLSGLSVAEIVEDGILSRMCGRGLCDFPGLSLWKQLGVLNAVEFAMRNGVPFEFPPGTDERTTLSVYVDVLARICRENGDSLLSRKTYLLVGASSPTIPHSGCAQIIREAAMRGICLAYALLPMAETMEGLAVERILGVSMDGVREPEKGMREVAGESILEAHKLRP
ncbi:hypothetical protein PENTCL1PPCAC_25517, partial [Pristionchus entomophagus]